MSQDRPDEKTQTPAMLGTNSWVTSSQRSFIERTLRFLAHASVVLILAAFLWSVWDVITAPEFEPLGLEGLMRGDSPERVTWSERIQGATWPSFMYLAFPVAFYWLAHFLRLGREEGSK